MKQPKPRPNSNQSIQQLVMKDLAKREAFGIRKYGTPLQAHNGRDALQDWYEELLDACCYAKQLLEERDAVG